MKPLIKGTKMKAHLSIIVKVFMVIFILTLPQYVQSQDTDTNRFSFSFAAGIGYTGFIPKDGPNYFIPNPMLIRFDVPKVIFVNEINFNFRLRDNRYFGFTYSKLNYSSTENYSRSFTDITIRIENYKNRHTVHHFGVEFRQEFIPRFYFGVGLSYFVHHSNVIYVRYFMGVPQEVEIGDDWEQRLDDLALSASLDFYFPINSFLQLGLRTKGFLTIAAFEALTLTPVMKISF